MYEKLINKFKNSIFRIWTPESPSKDSCLKLLKFGLNYQVAVISILNNWNEIYLECDVKSDIFI